MHDLRRRMTPPASPFLGEEAERDRFHNSAGTASERRRRGLFLPLEGGGWWGSPTTPDITGSARCRRGEVALAAAADEIGDVAGGDRRQRQAEMAVAEGEDDARVVSGGRR